MLSRAMPTSRGLDCQQIFAGRALCAISVIVAAELSSRGEMACRRRQRRRSVVQC